MGPIEILNSEITIKAASPTRSYDNLETDPALNTRDGQS